MPSNIAPAIAPAIDQDQRQIGRLVRAYGNISSAAGIAYLRLEDLLQGDGTLAVGTHGSRSGRWRLSRAFLLGAVLGGAFGALWGWLDYGAFEIGHFSNYILGCFFLGGFAFLAAAALRNWARRNPL